MRTNITCYLLVIGQKNDIDNSSDKNPGLGVQKIDAQSGLAKHNAFEKKCLRQIGSRMISCESFHSRTLDAHNHNASYSQLTSRVARNKPQRYVREVVGASLCGNVF